MGVTGLWKLIEPCGKPVPVETLEGKVLAVDISIWLHQVVKGFQDSKGSALNNAHLLGLFHRLCKLLYYRVRPVFIFDGGVPQLKRDTIARRQQQRGKISNEADRIQALLLQSLAKEKVVQQALGTNAELLLKSPSKRAVTGKGSRNDEDDLFKLPELPEASAAEIGESDCELDNTGGNTTSDSSFDESTARHTYNASLQGIDVRSQHFKSLPADIRHEILTDIKETRKQSSWGRLHELPARSNDFSSFQMKRLLKRRAVQESLEQAQQEMGGHTLTYAELSEFFSEEGIVTPTAIEQSTRQISSDEHTRFLLVRDLKKKTMEDSRRMAQKSFETIAEESAALALESDESPGTSTKTVAVKKSPPPNDTHNKEPGAAPDGDYEMALALFLDESQKVYDEEDYNYNADQDLRLNREQSKFLRYAAKGPARAYMIEYGGMNDEEVENIMESTQLNDTQSLERLLHNRSADDKITEVDIANNSIEKVKQLSSPVVQTTNEYLDKPDSVQIIESDTDSDLEEVTDTKEMPAKTSLEICVGIKDQLNEEDDLFSDIFKNEYPVKDSVLQEADAEATMNTEKTNMCANEAEHKNERGDNKSTDLIIKCKNVSKFDSNHSNVEDSEERKTLEQSTVKHDKEKTIDLNAKKTEKEVELSSILSDLKRQTEEIKNTKFDLSEEKEQPDVGLTSILNELKRQTDEVKNIKLESVKLNNSMAIELSSDDEAAKEATSPKSKDIIELCDSDNEMNRTSPNKTPSKNKAITDFFQTTYSIKRTPDKPVDPHVTPPVSPMVPKPYYVKRTPKSGRKSAGKELRDNSVSPNTQSSKAAKSLFKENEEKDMAEPVTTEVKIYALIFELAKITGYPSRRSGSSKSSKDR
ncbi:DNA excision repair protein ERCC-5 isoform X2 [Drosophila montana]|uniref:DNA excision repair protein ERCC-5 isoform X2 n=1 Tax=Drosophila montana TaxID=40370 RepID=UPI00313AACEC